MKLVYVLAQSHTGSTLLDSILGEHRDFQSTGEFRHFPWQLFRTLEKLGTVEDESACSCGEDFRNCSLWSQVIKVHSAQKGINIADDPYLLNVNFFNLKSYRERGGERRNFYDRMQSRLVREIMENGGSLKLVIWLFPSVKLWLSNLWDLYSTISQVSDSKFVVDSSKDPTQALLLKKFRPTEVHIVFLHRSVEGIVASAKRRAKKKGYDFSLDMVLKQKQAFESKVLRYKDIISDGAFTDVNYEDLVKDPGSFLDNLANKLGVASNISKADSIFYIEPAKSHIVAGNPMRYRGKQLVRYDDRWKKELSGVELEQIARFKKKYNY